MHPQPTSGAGTAPAPILAAVDGTNLLHRAHHAHSSSGRRDSDGYPVWALWGLARMLERACSSITERFRAPAGITVAFDGPRDTCRRRQLDPGYKATVHDRDPALRQQLAAAPEWLRACGFDVDVFDGYEADDGCASAAKTAEANGWRCVIVTSDRDALAHASNGTRVLRPVNGGGWDVYGTAQIAAKYGLPKIHGTYAAYAALRGDPSDELPGVPGIGEKTAAAVLCALADVDRTVEDVLDADPVATAALRPRHVELLFAGAANYRRNRRLMDAVVDLPVELSAAAAPLDEAAVRDACAAWGVADAERSLLAAAAPRLAAPA